PTASIGPPSRSWPPTPANKRSSKFSGASRKATGSTGNPCITGPTARSACTLFTACWVSPCCTTFAAKPRPSGPRSPSKICRKSWSKSNSSYSCIPPRVRVLIEPPPWSPPRASSKKAWPKPWACNNSVVPHVGNTAVSWQLNEKSTTSRSFWRVRSKLPLANTVLLKEAGVGWISALPWNQAPAEFRQRPVEGLPACSSAQPGVQAAAEKLLVHGEEYLCVLKYSATFAAEQLHSVSASLSK